MTNLVKANPSYLTIGMYICTHFRCLTQYQTALMVGGIYGTRLRSRLIGLIRCSWWLVIQTIELRSTVNKTNSVQVHVQKIHYQR